MKLKHTLSALFLFMVIGASAQIKGKITDSTGEALAFASIYIQGTSQGTTTNDEGDYFFELSPGEYNIVFQYVGYQQQVETIILKEKIIELNIVLESEAVDIKTVVISANAEDPAYAVIRNAIAKRSYYKNLINAYSCDVYIKGNHKFLDAPEKIFGQEIGDLGGSLDSNRQGIIYLAESQAKLYVERPDKVKEHMISTKVSGNDNGFGFNRASMMDFSFYDNHIELTEEERKLLSPIANTALQYYRYKLIGTLFDEAGRLINKIEVIPKRREDPVFSGLIYIVEDLWNIQSAELMITGASIKQPVLDTMTITQVHIPVQGKDGWALLSQSLDFKFGVLGFKVKGNFTGIFSNYNIEPEFTSNFFSNEIFKVEEGANDKQLAYWDTIRPIPLTEEESLDYIKKDSLQVIWKSKEFLDSIDQKNNKFKVWDLLLGYDWDNSYERKSFSLAAPIGRIGFNTIQGVYGDLDFTYLQRFDDYYMKWFRINPKIQYGFADERVRGEMNLLYNFNRTKFTRLEISGGSMVAQFNSNNPITPFLNTYTSLFTKRNYIRLYQREFAKIKFRQELVNGLLFNGSLTYEDRSRLTQNSDYSFFKRDRVYANNIPAGLESIIRDHQSLNLEMSFRFRFKQKYLSYPNRKYIVGSDLPDFWLHYRKGISALGADTNFDQIWFNFWDELSFGIVGKSAFNIEAGTFLNKNELPFNDFQHFNGNQIIIADPLDYLSSFMLLPYYDWSTPNSWVQIHYNHHFEGFLIDKIPLLRKLKLKTVVGASFLYTKENKDYIEFNFGIDNLGFGAFRIFRFDIVTAFNKRQHLDTGFVIGVTL